MNDPLTDFRSLYSSARFFVRQGNAKDARLYILALLDILKKILADAPTVISRIKTETEIYRFLDCSRILREQGVTDEVREMFGLVSSPVPKTDAEKPEGSAQKLVPEWKDEGSKPIDCVNEECSQGWCADLFESYRHAVVKVRAQSSRTVSGGTGFFISPHGFLLTNDHVVFDETDGGIFRKICVQFEGEDRQYPVRVITTSKKWDVALLAIEEPFPQFSVIPRIKEYSALRQGADVLVIGNAFSMGLAPFAGTVKYTHDADCGNLIYTAPSNPGDSGGPVLARSGECVGINKSMTTSITRGSEVLCPQGFTNATPMDRIDELLACWVKLYGLEL